MLFFNKKKSVALVGNLSDRFLQIEYNTVRELLIPGIWGLMQDNYTTFYFDLTGGFGLAAAELAFAWYAAEEFRKNPFHFIGLTLREDRLHWPVAWEKRYRRVSATLHEVVDLSGLDPEATKTDLERYAADRSALLICPDEETELIAYCKAENVYVDTLSSLG